MYGTSNFARGLGALLFVAFAPSLRAQCAQWADGFSTSGVTESGDSVLSSSFFANANDSLVYDDGSGAALYVCGDFQHAGSSDASGVARYDGTRWHEVGEGLPFEVYALGVFDAGDGPALYAGSARSTAAPVDLAGLAKWNGSRWTTVDLGAFDGSIHALYAFDDGSGPSLFVGGSFNSIHGAGVNIAKWNGTTWSSLASGAMSVHSGDVDRVESLFGHDDGSGLALYVGGVISHAGGVAAEGLARWNGSTWNGFGLPTFTRVYAFAEYDDGGGSALYFSGGFVSSGSAWGVGKWDGTTATPLGGGMPAAFALGVFDDGSGNGPELYAAGSFDSAFGVSARNVAKWDGTTWRATGDGLGRAGAFEMVETLTAFQGELYAGGSFHSSGTLGMNGVAQWSGSAWTPTGTGDGIGGRVQSFAIHDDGTGPALYAGGMFRSAGESEALNVARWTGNGWARVGDGLTYLGVGIPGVAALASYDDGAGSKLYAGGRFVGNPLVYSVASWNGSTWSPLGGQLHVSGLTVYDPPGAIGPNLISVSDLDADVLRFDGSNWTTIGTTNGLTYAASTYLDAGVSRLVIGGAFTTVNGVSTPGVAQWDGTTWSSLGAGVGFPVRAFAQLPSKNGLPELYAAVDVVIAGVPHASIQRWNGSTWTIVGDAPPSSHAYALAAISDGSTGAAALFVGGEFESIAGVAAENLARFDGTTWSAALGGVDGDVNALCAFRDSTDAAPDLFVGGRFGKAGGEPSRSIAKWQGCTGPGTPYCFADGTLATACPCAAPNTVPVPQGSAFGGCANAFNPHGASLTAVGATNPDTVTLHATGLTPAGFTVFIKSDALASGGFASHDGVRCTGGSFVRFGSQNAVGGTARYPNPALGLTLPLSVVGSTPPGSGLSAYYQPFYRNVTASFCNAGTINFTSTYGVIWN